MGRVYSWGKCHFGQLGFGEENFDLYYPSLIPSLSSLKMKALGAGMSFSFSITEGGVLYSWGCGFYGSLGHGDEHSIYLPQKVTFSFLCV